MRNDNVHDAAFGACTCNIENTNEDLLVPESQRNFVRSESHGRHCSK